LALSVFGKDLALSRPILETSIVLQQKIIQGSSFMLSERLLRLTEKVAVLAVGLLLLAGLFTLGQKQRYYKQVDKARQAHPEKVPSEVAPK
jgi:hypothetical protein